MRQTRNNHLAAMALTAAATIGVAACGAGSKSPGVASLSGSGRNAGATTTTLPKGTPTQLLDEWAACMRQHGAPNQADPTIDSNGVIHIDMGNKGNGPVSLRDSSSPCSPYLDAASVALGGHGANQRPSFSKLLTFSKCMRSHGIADFPDPSPGGGLSLRTQPGSDLNPSSPTFQSASKTCSKKAGVPGFGTGTPQRGAIEATSGGPGPGSSGGPDKGSGSAGQGIVSGGS